FFLFCLTFYPFYDCCLHLDLHSFPTRRSSDLGHQLHAVIRRLPLAAALLDLLARRRVPQNVRPTPGPRVATARPIGEEVHRGTGDRKSTRLNSSHVSISYAVFCLKKKRYVARP